jgi:hypothetical protein
MSRRILLHCPEALVAPHHSGMLLVGRSLVELGHSAIVSVCRGEEERCVVMDSRSTLPADVASLKSELCGQCVAASHRNCESYGLSTLDLAAYLTDETRAEAAAIVEATERSGEGLHDLTFEGIDFGGMCCHDVVLMWKVLEPEALAPEPQAHLRQALRTSLALYLAMKRALPEHGITDVLVYGQYGQNLAVIAAAKAQGLNFRIIQQINHRGIDRRFMHVLPAVMRAYRVDTIAAWPRWRDIPMTPAMVRETAEDMLARFDAQQVFVYSPPKTGTDLRAALGLAADRKLIVAFTSSYDEEVAQEAIERSLPRPFTPPLRERPFEQQRDWLKFLVGWVGARSDLQLVIRIHPREGRNRRDGMRSQHLELLQQDFAELPGNVRVVWPEDPISSYDLCEIADQVQTGWSTVGSECARMALPVLSFDTRTVNFPVGDFVAGAETRDGFVALIDRLLDEPPRLDRLVAAMRFYALSRFHGAIALDDVVPRRDWWSLPAFKPPAAAPDLARSILSDESCEAINYQRAAPRRGDTTAEAAELAAIRREIRRLLHVLLLGQDCLEDYELQFQPVAPDMLDRLADAPAPGRVELLADARGEILWRSAAHTVRRYSPLARRLAMLGTAAAGAEPA